MAQDGTQAGGAQADTGNTGRALVAAQDMRNAGSMARMSLADAGFLTQIIASAGHLGHFRRYRRAEPAIAMSSYRAAARL
jgi:hypothetical protein